jgi:DtxR family Mn-dependent transcriptional regulator
VASLTVENYVKAVFKIATAGNGRATTGQLAAELSVSPGTVTSMLKNLSQNGLAAYTPYEGVRLTESGEALALQILRRHRLLELFLARVLALDWNEVHEHAEHLEHAIRDDLIDRIDAYLGHPECDPHGDPIPRADGSLTHRRAEPLVSCPVGSQFCVTRVVDQSPGFLRRLDEWGVELGSAGQVIGRCTQANEITVCLHGREVTLGGQAAEKLLVVIPAEAPLLPPQPVPVE